MWSALREILHKKSPKVRPGMVCNQKEMDWHYIKPTQRQKSPNSSHIKTMSYLLEALCLPGVACFPKQETNATWRFHFLLHLQVHKDDAPPTDKGRVCHSTCKETPIWKPSTLELLSSLAVQSWANLCASLCCFISETGVMTLGSIIERVNWCLYKALVM